MVCDPGHSPRAGSQNFQRRRSIVFRSANSSGDRIAVFLTRRVYSRGRPSGRHAPKDAAIDRDRTRALRTEFRKRAGSLLSYLRWDEIRWLSFEMPDSEHANLTGRFIDRESDTCIPFRWWLVNRQGDWRVFDVELSDHGLRLSLALAMDSAAKFRLPWLDDLNNVGANYDPTDSYEGEFDSYDALDISDEMIAGPVPAEAHAFVHYCRIQLMSETGEDIELLLEELADFDSLAGDFPVRTRLRGWLLSLTDDYPGAIEAYEAWSSQTGYNAKTLEAIADCWWQLDNREKAVEFALRGLADSELSEGCLATLAVALPPGRKSELDEHFEKHSFSADVLASTIDWCTANNDREAALHCYRLLRQHHPDSELQEHYRNALEIEDF
jgi:tetratricopeptide (TPR) repeat protein